MTAVVLIGVASAFAMCFIVMKARRGNPKKVDRREKAEIIKRLLALSEHENMDHHKGNAAVFRGFHEVDDLRMDGGLASRELDHFRAAVAPAGSGIYYGPPLKTGRKLNPLIVARDNGAITGTARYKPLMIRFIEHLASKIATAGLW